MYQNAPEDSHMPETCHLTLQEHTATQKNTSNMYACTDTASINPTKKTLLQKYTFNMHAYCIKKHKKEHAYKTIHSVCICTSIDKHKKTHTYKTIHSVCIRSIERFTKTAHTYRKILSTCIHTASTYPQRAHETGIHMALTPPKDTK